MRAPATSPIPAPISAPQPAKGNEASEASPFAALMDAAANDARTEKADARTANAEKTSTEAAQDKRDQVTQDAQDEDARQQDVRLRGTRQQDTRREGVRQDDIRREGVRQDGIRLQNADADTASAEAADTAASLLTPPPALPAMLVAQEQAQADEARDGALIDAAIHAADAGTQDKTQAMPARPGDMAPPAPMQALDVTPSPDPLNQIAMAVPAMPTPPPANSNLPNAAVAQAEPSEPVAPQIPLPQQAGTAQATTPQPAEAPVSQSADSKSPGPNINIAQTEDAPIADAAAPAPAPAPKTGKQANAKSATANTVHDTPEQRLEGNQTALLDRVTPDATPMVSALQTMPQATQPAPDSATQQAADVADAVNAAPPATTPHPAPKDSAANNLPALPASAAQDVAAPPQSLQADTAQKSGQKAEPADPHGKTSDIASTAAEQLAQAAPEAPRPQAPAANTNFTQHLAAVTDGDTPVQPGAPGITQHVTVARADAAPDLPSLAINIRARSQSGAKQFDIRLDPPELGRVEVRLSIDHAGKASAHLTADQPQTLDLLQKDSALLARALRDAGLNVSQDGLNFSLRQGSQDTGAQDMGGRDGTRGQRGTTLTASKSIEATATSAAYRAPADGRLDIRV